MIVSDASILINLARIGELDLLRKLYVEIHVPEAVWQETVVSGAGHPGAKDIGTAGWIKRIPVKNKHLVQALNRTWMLVRLRQLLWHWKVELNFF